MEYKLNTHELQVRCKRKGMDYIQFKNHLNQVIEMGELLFKDLEQTYIQATNNMQVGYLLDVKYLKLDLFNELYQPIILQILKQNGIEFYTLDGVKGWLINK